MLLDNKLPLKINPFVTVKDQNLSPQGASQSLNTFGFTEIKQLKNSKK